ncbi:11267_t:CDS:2, partial [Scutellospora calospora]
LVPTSNQIVEDIDMEDVNFNIVDDYYEIDIDDDEFQLPKGWVVLGSTRFGKKGSRKKIKAKVVSILKQLFLNGNLNPKDKLIAKEMHEELLRFVDSEEIEEDHKGTVIKLETFKATGSSPNSED